MIADVFTALDGNRWGFWLLPAPVVAWLTAGYWAQSSNLNSITAPIEVIINDQAGRTKGSYVGGFNSFVVGIFILILLINWGGLIPYVFSVSSHLLFTLPLALCGWIALITSGWSFNTKSAVAGLIPRGAPAALGPFLILVETLRVIIRPITLAVRLAANIRAGHLIIGLVGAYLVSTFRVAFFQVVYRAFEMGICLVQAYVFTLLLTLYADEHPL